MAKIKLTQYSHGAGCGCKISPKILDTILTTNEIAKFSEKLLVGNNKRDDAAVYLINDDTAIISTTDFFMPIVDDPFDFGVIASVNAISDVYAMGGTPLMAIAILGWPLDKLSSEIAAEVLDGARDACKRAKIPLAGGHSIDAPEPIFGLSVTGSVQKEFLKTNDTAEADCELYLSKPLGIGIMTTAQKKGLLKENDFSVIRKLMFELNDLGAELSKLKYVKALTDVTGFGLLGHLIEICEGSNLSAEINFKKIPQIDNLHYYLDKKTFPGGIQRNFDSYGHKVNTLSEEKKTILCDPQTSGGLLIVVEKKARSAFQKILEKRNMNLEPFGTLVNRSDKVIKVY